MKKIKFNGEFTITDNVFEYLKTQGMITDNNNNGVCCVDDTFRFFIYDVLNQWILRENTLGIQHTTSIADSLTQTNKLLSTLIDNKQISINIGVPIQQSYEDKYKPVQVNTQQNNDLNTEYKNLTAPNNIEKSVEVVETTSHQNIKQQKLSPDEIRNKLSGFIKTN